MLPITVNMVENKRGGAADCLRAALVGGMRRQVSQQSAQYGARMADRRGSEAVKEAKVWSVLRAEPLSWHDLAQYSKLNCDI